MTGSLADHAALGRAYETWQAAEADARGSNTPCHDRAADRAFMLMREAAIRCGAGPTCRGLVAWVERRLVTFGSCLDNGFSARCVVSMSVEGAT